MPKKQTGTPNAKQPAKRAKVPKRWEVKVVLESLDEATFFISGRNQAEAEEAADREFADGGVYDFERIWSEYTLEVTPLHSRHDPYPVAAPDRKGSVCKLCLEPVTWTGIAADDPENRSGKTIPGPWIHTKP